nr:hypothetical protein BN444_01590 [Xanthomonas translucens pv. translucens DSM 18974]
MKSLQNSGNPSRVASGTAKVVFPAPGAPDTSTILRRLSDMACQCKGPVQGIGADAADHLATLLGSRWAHRQVANHFNSRG